jgi:hypothetical protein
VSAGDQYESAQRFLASSSECPGVAEGLVPGCYQYNLAVASGLASDLPVRRPGRTAPCFNIAGNKFRLITRVEYQRQEIYIRNVLTHAEYDKEDWKRDPWFQRS